MCILRPVTFMWVGYVGKPVERVDYLIDGDPCVDRLRSINLLTNNFALWDGHSRLKLFIPCIQ